MMSSSKLKSNTESVSHILLNFRTEDDVLILKKLQKVTREVVSFGFGQVTLTFPSFIP